MDLDKTPQWKLCTPRNAPRALRVMCRSPQSSVSLIHLLVLGSSCQMNHRHEAPLHARHCTAPLSCRRPTLRSPHDSLACWHLHGDAPSAASFAKSHSPRLSSPCSSPSVLLPRRCCFPRRAADPCVASCGASLSCAYACSNACCSAHACAYGSLCRLAPLP
jgi:hypothetical protein